MYVPGGSQLRTLKTRYSLTHMRAVKLESLIAELEDALLSSAATATDPAVADRWLSEQLRDPSLGLDELIAAATTAVANLCVRRNSNQPPSEKCDRLAQLLCDAVQALHKNLTDPWRWRKFAEDLTREVAADGADRSPLVPPEPGPSLDLEARLMAACTIEPFTSAAADVTDATSTAETLTLTTGSAASAVDLAIAAVAGTTAVLEVRASVSTDSQASGESASPLGRLIVTHPRSSTPLLIIRAPGITRDMYEAAIARQAPSEDLAGWRGTSVPTIAKSGDDSTHLLSERYLLSTLVRRLHLLPESNSTVRVWPGSAGRVSLALHLPELDGLQIDRLLLRLFPLVEGRALSPQAVRMPCEPGAPTQNLVITTPHGLVRLRINWSETGAMRRTGASSRPSRPEPPSDERLRPNSGRLLHRPASNDGPVPEGPDCQLPGEEDVTDRTSGNAASAVGLRVLVPPRSGEDRGFRLPLSGRWVTIHEHSGTTSTGITLQADEDALIITPPTADPEPGAVHPLVGIVVTPLSHVHCVWIHPDSARARRCDASGLGDPPPVGAALTWGPGQRAVAAALDLLDSGRTEAVVLLVEEDASWNDD